MTAVGWAGEESAPSEEVYARPSVGADDLIEFESPAYGQFNLPLPPTFRWRSVTNARYYVVQVARIGWGVYENVWLGETTAFPAPLSVVYGQTQDVKTWLTADGPLTADTDYELGVCAVDEGNWMFGDGFICFSTGLGRISCRSAKIAADNAPVHIKNGAIVTATRPGVFYVEDPSRRSGIALQWPYAQWITVGDRAWQDVRA
jgi:hypothetical protein